MTREEARDMVWEARKYALCEDGPPWPSIPLHPLPIRTPPDWWWDNYYGGEMGHKRPFRPRWHRATWERRARMRKRLPVEEIPF